MATQRLFRSDDTSKWTYKYGTRAQGSKTFSSNTTLSSTEFFYNGAITGTEAAFTGATTNIADGVYNLPCLIIQTKGTGSNVTPNCELNVLVSVSSNVATFKYPLSKTWNAGAQIVTSGNWSNVITDNGVAIKPPAYSSSSGYGGVAFMLGKGKFIQAGTGNVDLRGLGFEKGNWHGNTTDADYGGFGGYGQAGRSGKGGFSGNGGIGQISGDFPAGGCRDRDGSSGSIGGATGENYTGGGGGGGANSHGGDESAGGGGGGGHRYGGGGGGSGTDSNGSGGSGGASNAVGGGGGGGEGANQNGGASGLNGGNATGASGIGGAANWSGAGGRGTEGAGRNGGGAGGGADANCTDADLKALHLGGGGGGGGNYTSNGGSDGSAGSGIALIIFPEITLTGGVLTTGVAGTSASSKGGGGGAGAAGDTRLVGVKVDVGSNCNAAGAAGGAPSNGGDGGSSSEARIHVDYANSIAGSSTPTLHTRQDKTLLSQTAAGAVALFL